jgi:hypothetical protein
MHVGGIFCDSAKSFDYVNHEILLLKLHYYDIQGTVAKWFRSHLTGRKQIITEIFLKIGNSKTWSSQGSILGSLLFVIYVHVNDPSPTINTLSEPILFADDTSVIISSKNSDDFSTMSNTVLSHMSKWFTSNKLVLNLDKTNVIIFITNESP